MYVRTCKYAYAHMQYTVHILSQHDSVEQESLPHDSIGASVLLQYSAAPPSLFAPEMFPSLLSPAQ